MANHHNSHNIGRPNFPPPPPPPWQDFKIGGKYLITTLAWFYAPDGKQYRAAWGSVQIFSDEILGVRTNRNATNWYAKVGSEDNHIIIAGCQIHYAVKCNNPKRGKVKDYISDTEYKTGERRSHIYFTE